MIGIAMTFAVLILAGVALGQAQAQAWCVFLYVSPCGTEICGLAFSRNTNIPSTEIAIMPQLGCALADNNRCSGETLLPYSLQLYRTLMGGDKL